MEANAKKFFSSVAISGLEAVTAKRRYLTKCEPKVMEIDDEEKIVKTACRACIANCGVLAHVKNGRGIKLEGNPVDPMSQGRMCVWLVFRHCTIRTVISIRCCALVNVEADDGDVSAGMRH